MKQFTIEVAHASGPQLQTIAAELKIMSHGLDEVRTPDHDQQASTRPPEAPGVSGRGQKRTSNKQAP